MKEKSDDKFRSFNYEGASNRGSVSTFKAIIIPKASQSRKLQRMNMYQVLLIATDCPNHKKVFLVVEDLEMRTKMI